MAFILSAPNGGKCDAAQFSLTCAFFSRQDCASNGVEHQNPAECKLRHADAGGQ